MKETITIAGVRANTAEQFPGARNKQVHSKINTKRYQFLINTRNKYPSRQCKRSGYRDADL